MFKTIHIFDFDGTLVDSSHRYRTQPCGTKIDLDHWIANEHKATEDKPLPLMQKYLDLLNSKTDYPVIATARIWDDATKAFLAKYGIDTKAVIARKNRADNRGGAQLKIQGIKRLLNLKQFQNVKQFHVYEDNISYLESLAQEFNAVKHFFPSCQGH